MADINSAVISGKIFRLWDEKQSSAGTTIRGGLLESEKYNGFKVRFNITAFGDAADSLGSFSEGDHVVIQGELDVNSWQKEGGEYVNSQFVKVVSIKSLAAGPVATGVSASADPSDDDFPF